MMHLGEDVTSKGLGHLARQPGEDGDKARTIWRVMGEALGVALANLVNTFNFPLYLLSGGMLPAWEHFAPAMLAEVERRSYTYRATQPGTRIEQATLGNEAGLIGAAYLPRIEK
jgi:glucokinase